MLDVPGLEAEVDQNEVDETDAPDAFLCPITYEIMRDPVVVADGHSYERKAIEQWLEKRSRSPMTAKPLTSKALATNHILKSITDNFLLSRHHS